MCKSVRFSAKPNVISKGKPTFKMTSSERATTWHNQNEIRAFRNNAKVACQIFRKQQKSSLENISMMHELRGLELGTDKERKKRKDCANKIIVLAQDTLNADKLATLSSSLSKLSTEKAIKYARFDFLAACSTHIR